MRVRYVFFSIAFFAAALSACGEGFKYAKADRVLTNAVVLTMNADNDTAEAVAIRGANILAVGSMEQVAKHIGSKTVVIDLMGKTLMPGFIDAHGHFPFTGDIALLMVDLNSPPIGTIQDMAGILAALEQKAANRPKGEWVVGIGYDDTLLMESRHPSREELDSVSRDHPIFIWHTSLHLGVANSAALRLAGLDPERHSGLLEEAGMAPIFAVLPQVGTDERLLAIRHAAREYAAQGVTTAQSGLTDEKTLLELAEIVKQERLSIRVLAWPGVEAARKIIAGKLKLEISDPSRLKIGAVKIIADGSIQGYTGYLSQPYHVTPPGKPGWRGYPAMPRQELADLAREFHDAGWQLAIHGNGDAAIDDILAAYRAMLEANPKPDARPIIVHAQMTREDQLNDMAELGVIPSFFSLHTYYWGDRHWKTFMGPARAAQMSPARSAGLRGIRYTIHADTPVTPMEPLRLVWSAVNRRSTNGAEIGAGQRITPIQALRAVTIDAATQSFDEAVKGSLIPGKFADLVVLSDNPLERPETIDEIEVLWTIVGGETVYMNPDKFQLGPNLSIDRNREEP